jgi:hypothetical protein
MAKSKKPGEIPPDKKVIGSQSGRDAKGHFIRGGKPVNGFDKRPQDINKDGHKTSAGMQFKALLDRLAFETEEYKDSANRKIVMQRAEATIRGVFARSARDSSADARIIFNYMLGLPMFRGKLELNPEDDEDELTAEQEAAAEAFLKDKIMGDEGDGSEE